MTFGWRADGPSVTESDSFNSVPFLRRLTPRDRAADRGESRMTPGS